MHQRFSVSSFAVALLAVVGALWIGRLGSGQPTTSGLLEGQPRWWRGNLHTHSFWSDGDDFPEMIVAWYKEHGYHFLALSDHNILSEGEKWIDAERHRDGAVVEALGKYRQMFGPWVEEKTQDDRPMVRLQPLGEFRALFEEPGRFLLIQSEEITDRFEELPVHLNATNLRDLIPPQGGGSVVEVIENNLNAVLNQRRRTGQPMIAHLNHPNYCWAVTAADLARVRSERFFEVYNGHPGVRNYGDREHPSTERLWDLVLAERLTLPGGQVLYGLATDDAHQYHQFSVGKRNPGRGWIMVRARHLTPEAIVHGIEQGDFYASTGVRLRDVASDSKRIRIEIEPEAGVSYGTEFIGTLSPDDAVATGGGSGAAAKIAETDIGRVLASTSDLEATYRLTGRELYVRARVCSSKPHPNPFAEGDVEMAWTQPVRPAFVDGH